MPNVPETGDCQGTRPLNGNSDRREASQDFLFKKFVRRRLGNRPSSSGHIEKRARQRQAMCL
jgi:hypothetical protein